MMKQGKILIDDFLKKLENNDYDEDEGESTENEIDNDNK